ncbi:tetratricopeptide repeat protein [Diaminobutyricibacter sp. McL0608]|uniref:tetratricopeptide repeat protein n=1 Tax=Leifsonia sp. McL0608 TaxID=3143537 RepID=UPI0031F32D22
MSDSPSDEQKPNREGDRPQRDGQRRDISRHTGGRPQGSRPSGNGEHSRPARSGNSDRNAGDKHGSGAPRKTTGGEPWRGGKPGDSKSGQPWKRDGKPGDSKSGQPWKRDGKPDSSGGRDGGPKKLWTRDGKPARGDRDARDYERALTEEERLARELRSVRTRHDDPEIPEAIQARDLDKVARAELKTLSKDNADWVARHLVMAAQLIEDEPELAHQHALSAARRAGRVAVVRETLAITAYATGDFGLALRELRTFRRISGSNDQLPLMVDSERGVGRPDRALELGRSVDRASLPTEVQVSLAIAMSGARLDLGQNDEALAELEIAQLDPNRAYSWSPELFHAYGDVLDELGREEDASTWRDRAARAEQAIGVARGAGDDETVDVVEEEIERDDADADVAIDASEAPSAGDALGATLDDESEGDVVIEFEDEDDDIEIVEGEDDSAADDGTADEIEGEDGRDGDLPAKA